MIGNARKGRVRDRYVEDTVDAGDPREHPHVPGGNQQHHPQTCQSDVMIHTRTVIGISWVQCSKLIIYSVAVKGPAGK